MPCGVQTVATRREMILTVELPLRPLDVEQLGSDVKTRAAMCRLDSLTL